MKNAIIAILMVFTFIGADAQQSTAAAAARKNIAPFRIQQANGIFYTASDLKKGTPVMIVYFDPDCDHCSVFTADLLKNINAFANVQIVMVTYVPLQTLKNYIAKTKLNQYPAIKTGTEGTNFIIRYHYNVVQFPYLALHDKNGNLFATYESEVPGAMQLAEMFKKK